MAGSNASRQDLQIVEAFSSVTVSDRLLRESNIKQLITDMVSAQTSVESTTTKLERARQAQKDGNVFANWWHDRDDAVQDGQLELSKAIGELTQKSSQLLIVNTAISKVLSDQQGVLLQQQQMLKSQAEALQAQNDKIYEQQKALEQQQKEINAANKGLMEAKGLTQEQAQKLVGCVVRVTDAEAKMEASNRALRQSVERQLQDAGAQYLEQLQAGFSAFRQEVAERSADTNKAVHGQLEAVYGQISAVESAMRQLDSNTASSMKQSKQETQAIVSGVTQEVARLEAALDKARRRQVSGLVAVAFLALAALGWQAAQHFAGF